MAHRAELAIDCGDAATARLVERTLAAEAGQGPDGSETVLSLDGATLRARIGAPDVATLRAAVNQVARQADVALRTVQPAAP